MVSVIVRNHNEGQFIGFAIQSVIDFIPNVEIIVVDDHSTDDSLDIVKLFNNRVDLTIITIDNYTPGKAINLGVSKSKYNTILVLSGHSQITKLDLDYINVKLMKYPAIFGKQTPIYKGKKISKRYIWSHFVDKEETNMYSKIEERYFLHNAFCFYTKKILIDFPFDESLPGKEDRYWAMNIVRDGTNYLYTPIIEVNHYYTTNGATWKGIG